MAKKFKKWLAMCLAVSLCMSLFTVQASAAENKCNMAEHTHGATCYGQVIDTTKCTKHMCDSEECEIAADLDLVCTKEVHTHTVEAGCYHKHSISGDCYELTCTKEAGQLDCGMTEESTICGIEAADCALTHDHEEGGCNGHTHIATCYHSHTDACNHTHADGCYATSHKCGKTEDVDLICTKDVHSHGNTVEQTCYEPHAHKDACYKTELTCTAEEHTHVAGCEYGLGVVALVGEIPYTTLKAAVAAANATEGGATIELLDNITLSEKLTIKKNITIDGNDYTITRGIAGTILAVDKNATLTLDGGVILDGNNNWTFDSAGYYADMAEALTLNTGAKNSYSTSEEGGINSTAAMITISGTKGAVVMNKATIQNSWAGNHNSGALFSVPAGATLNTNEGSLIQHIRNSVAGQIKGTWNMNGGKIDGVFAHNTNGGLADPRGGTVNINGGEITNVTSLGLNANGNGILFQVHGESSKLNITNGYIHDNASFSPGGGWGCQVYMNRGGDFTMTGGTIENTKSDKCTAVVSNTSTSIELLGGTMEVDRNKGKSFDSLIYGDVTIGKDMNIVGAENALIDLLGDPGDTLTIDGEVSGGTIQLMYNEPVTGTGTITSDVLITADDYFGFDGKVVIADANWLDSVITVDSVGSDASLTVKPDATIDGVQVRVLDSVTSGDYLNAEEAAAAQADSYVSEGGNVVSPVLYYHRLSSDQKKDIVVTYDYNGGLDASGWSGSQITSAEAFVPTAPAPTNGSLKLAGWAYAVDNDPESLSMADDGDYSGEEIAQSVRLIAQWTKNTGNRPNNDRPSNNRPSGGSDLEEIEEIEVPLAGGPLWLNTTDHNAYLNGFGDGTLRPYDGITRGQVATIFFRLLTDEARAMFWSETNDFTDCGEDLWCNTAISTLSNMGIISGYEDGTFRPDVKVTRAQFAKIMVGFFGVDQFGYTGLFSDVAEDAWHSRYVETASRLGLIQGYSNGIFNPNANITRAQACVIVNRALVRIADEEHLLPLDEMLTWSDNTPDDWFYADMMEATNSHDYLWLDTETDIVEQWTEKLEQPDWAELEKLWSEIYGG